MTCYVRLAEPHEMEGLLDFILDVFPDADVELGEDDRMLLAEEDGKLLGFAHIIELDDKVILQGLGVEESHRGQGVGSTLIERMCELYDRSDKPIYLKAKVSNPAIDLYSRNGFFLKKFGNVHVLVRRRNC
ncbi:MAG: GNAT family N-acetyltransferase [Candidatus Micrarchaeota archaeon]